MDLDRKKKIAIIASIIGGSVIVLIICVWVLVAAITNNPPQHSGETATNTTIEETPTPTADLTPSISNTPSLENSPSEIIDPTPTPSPSEETSTPQGKIPNFSTMINRSQKSYNSDKKTTDLEISFQIDEPGKVYIIAVDSVHNFNPTSQQVIEHVITGEMLSHPNARRVDTVDKNDTNKNTFSITIGLNKVDIFIVLESSDGKLFSKPTKLTFTPSAPTLAGNIEAVVDERNVEFKNVELTQEGYINVLFIKNDSNILGDANKLIAVAQGENSDDLLLKYRSKRITSKEDISFRIDDEVNIEDLQNSKIVILIESPNGSFDNNFRVISFE